MANTWNQNDDTPKWTGTKCAGGTEASNLMRTSASTSPGAGATTFTVGMALKQSYVVAEISPDNAIGQTSINAGTHYINLNVTTAAASGTYFDAAYICRLNSSGVSQGVVASWTGNVACDSTGVKQITVTQGSPVACSATDYLYVVVSCYCNAHAGSTLGLDNDQTYVDTIAAASTNYGAATITGTGALAAIGSGWSILTGAATISGTGGLTAVGSASPPGVTQYGSAIIGGKDSGRQLDHLSSPATNTAFTASANGKITITFTPENGYDGPIVEFRRADYNDKVVVACSPSWNVGLIYLSYQHPVSGWHDISNSSGVFTDGVSSEVVIYFFGDHYSVLVDTVEKMNTPTPYNQTVAAGWIQHTLVTNDIDLYSYSRPGGSLAAASTVKHWGASTISGTGALTAIGSAQGTKYGVATLVGTGELTSVANATHYALATSSGIGSLTTSGHAKRWRAATISATGSLAAIGSSQATKYGTSTITAVGALTAAGSATHYGIATLSATGQLSASGNAGRWAAATLAAIGTLSATAQATSTKYGSATISATGALTAIGDVTLHKGKSTLSGIGLVTSVGFAKRWGAATLAGLGSLTASGGTATKHYGVVTIGGQDSGHLVDFSTSTPNNTRLDHRVNWKIVITFTPEDGYNAVTLQPCYKDWQNIWSLTCSPSWDVDRLIFQRYKDSSPTVIASITGLFTDSVPTEVIWYKFGDHHIIVVDDVEKVNVYDSYLQNVDGQDFDEARVQTTLQTNDLDIYVYSRPGGSLAAGANAEHFAAATIAGIGSLTAVGSTQGIRYGTATLAGVGALTAVGDVVLHRGKATLAGVGALTAIGTNPTANVNYGQATLSATGSLTSVAGAFDYRTAILPRTTWPDGVVTGDQADYGAGWELGAYVYYPVGTATISAIGGLSARGSTGGVNYGIAALSGIGALTATANALHYSNAILIGQGSAVVNGFAKRYRAASLTGAGTLSAIGNVTKKFGKATISGVGALTAVGLSKKAGAATLSGAGSLSAQASVSRFSRAALSAIGAMNASGFQIAYAIGTITIITYIQASARIEGEPESIGLPRFFKKIRHNYASQVQVGQKETDLV